MTNPFQHKHCDSKHCKNNLRCWIPMIKYSLDSQNLMDCPVETKLALGEIDTLNHLARGASQRKNLTLDSFSSSFSSDPKPPDPLLYPNGLLGPQIPKRILCSRPKQEQDTGSESEGLLSIHSVSLCLQYCSIQQEIWGLHALFNILMPNLSGSTQEPKPVGEDAHRKAPACKHIAKNTSRSQ